MCDCLLKIRAVFYIEDDKVVGYKIEDWDSVGKQTDRKVLIEHCLLNKLGFSIMMDKTHNYFSKAGAVLYIENEEVVGYKIEGGDLVGDQTDRNVVIERYLLDPLGFSVSRRGR